MRAQGEFVSAGSRLYYDGDQLRAMVVVKASFAFVARGPMRLINVHRLQLSNRFYDDDPRRSLRLASDVAPVLPQPEVTLIGNAESSVPVSSRLVRLVLTRGQRLLVDKSLLVLGNRTAAPGQSPPEPAPFSTMPICYERAVGGPNNVDNPSGTGLGPTVGGQIVYPNVIYPEAVRQTVPAGFGPIAPSSAFRKRFLGPDAQAQLTATVAVIGPTGIPPEFFQTVPIDQRSPEALHGDERITLVGLVKDAEVLETDLPRAHARARVRPSGADPFDVELKLDTVALDTQACTANLLFRGSFAIAAEGILAGLTIEGTLREADGNEHTTPCPALPTKVPRPIVRATSTAVWDAPASATQTIGITSPEPGNAAAVPFAGKAVHAAASSASVPSAPIPGAPWTSTPTATAPPARQHQISTFAGIDAAPLPPSTIPVVSTGAPLLVPSPGLAPSAPPAPAAPVAPARILEPFSGSPGAQFLAAMESPYE